MGAFIFWKNAAVLIHKSLISTLPPEISLIDLGPSRFNDVKNPEVLLNVFTLYVNLDPNAGRVIYNIYKKNISDYYKLKKTICKPWKMISGKKNMNSNSWLMGINHPVRDRVHDQKILSAMFIVGRIYQK